MLAEVSAVDLGGAVVAGALVVGEGDGDLLGAVVGDVAVLAQLGGHSLVHHRTNKVIEVGVAQVAPVGGGAEAEASRGNGPLGYRAVGVGRQVVYLIEHEQSELTEYAAVDGRRVVGNHGHRLEVLVTPAPCADIFLLEVSVRQKRRAPLPKQIQRGHANERVRVQRRD